VDARQQKHRNKHNGCGCQRQIHYFRCDIGKNIAFGHGRLPQRSSDNHDTCRIWDEEIAFTRMQSKFIFPGGKLNEAVPDRRGPYHCRHLRASLPHRILGLFGGSVGAPINASI
jgi:hypothetical protein